MKLRCLKFEVHFGFGLEHPVNLLEFILCCHVHITSNKNLFLSLFFKRFLLLLKKAISDM